jgi:hypothetical protein
MKKLLTFLFVIGLPCFAIGAAATNTPTATNTPKPGVPGSSLASLQQTQIALQRAIATMGTSGNTTIYAQATIIANQLALAQAVATRDANGITGNVNAIVYGGKNVEVGTSTPGPIALDEKGRVIISVPSPTQTYTPTKTPTVDVSMTPMAGNQYTPTMTPYIVRFVPTMLIGSPTPISMNTPIPGSYTELIINGGSFSNLGTSAVTIQFFENWSALTPMKVIAPYCSWPPGDSVTFYDLDMKSTWQYLPLGAAATQSGSVFFLPHKTPLPMPQ